MLNRRTALLLKDGHGNIGTWDPFSRRRLVGASLSIVVWAGCSAWRRSSSTGTCPSVKKLRELVPQPLPHLLLERPCLLKELSGF